MLLATSTYAEAFNKDPEFYDFTRSLKAYRETLIIRATFCFLIQIVIISSI
ncbi:MAG: hypothetical protein CM15mP12_3300 [Gammaproteobacteria bacterium]|nr:MAG: hypothetical protein CM15mP12_3300 [Gammaproteobacteria bacterium]